MIVFGPVPSRRLGRSLGVNNIPPKECSYACLYCQVGATTNKSIERKSFAGSDEIYVEVKRKIEENADAIIDYLTIVSNGEPTLDINLKETIEKLKELGIKVAVITNSSLIWMDEVKSALNSADLVSLKVDSVIESKWKILNNPQIDLELEKILDGILDFSKNHVGKLITETMLVDGINEDELSIKKTAEFISIVNPDRAYISIPTRPPASKSIHPASTAALNLAYQIFDSKNIKTEFLINYEGNDFEGSKNIEDLILNTTSVHPMRRDAINKLLSNAGKSWNVIENLMTENKIKVIDYGGNTFVLRNFINKP